MMKTSLKGRIALAVSEGVVDKPYLDSVGVWTVGIGHTKNAGPPDPVDNKGREFSIEQIMNIFEKDLATFEARVNKLVKVPLEQHEFDALVHFDFNTGGLHKSALLRNLNAGKKKLAWDKGFHGWLKPASLIGRRDKERKMAQLGDYGSTVAPFYTANERGKKTREGVIDIGKHSKPVKSPVQLVKPTAPIAEAVLTKKEISELPAAPTEHTDVISVAGPQANETTLVVVQDQANAPAAPVAIPKKRTGIMVLVGLIVSIATYFADKFGG